MARKIECEYSGSGLQLNRGTNKLGRGRGLYILNVSDLYPG